MAILSGSRFAPPTNRPPAFTRIRPKPGQKYAVGWVKTRLRTIYRESLAGRCDWLGETAAHLYLLLATYVLDGRFMTELIELRELVAIMHCKTPITTTRAQRRLVERLEVELVDGGQGKAYVQFAFSKMKGPVFAESGGAAAASDGRTSQRESEVTSQRESEVTSQRESEVACTSESKSEVQPPTLSILEEEDQSSTSARRAALALHVQVGYGRADDFDEWWTENYPLHNAGVLNSVRDCDRDAAFALLCDRTLERVQAMAVVLWGAQPGGDPRSYIGQRDRLYIAQSDRSIRVLLQKQTVIEREVLRLGLDRPEGELLWEEILNASPHSARQWLTNFKFVADVDGVVRIWAPATDDLERVARFGLEPAIAAAVNRVLGPRRLEFIVGDGQVRAEAG